MPVLVDMSIDIRVAEIIEALIGKTRHGEKGEAHGKARGRHQEAAGLA